MYNDNLSKRKGELSEAVCSQLRCSSGSIPLIYGLPKIHKPGTPLRPIVSFCTSPTYSLSKHLVKILSPLLGTTSSTMRNSGDFASFVHSVALSDEVLVSFDVVSLFTKAPIDLALNVAQKHLESDEALCELTGLLIASVMSLLSFCLNATYFSFRGVFHKQMFSTAMGSPISVVVANLAMESIKSRALSTFPSPPLFWKHYVDDVCFAVKPEDVLPFFRHINSIHSSIQFTREGEDLSCH